MKLTRVTRLNEGPLDFIRGAGAEVGNKIRNSGVGRAATDIYQAGKTASGNADFEALLKKFTATAVQVARNDVDGTSAQRAPAPAQQAPAQQAPAQRVPVNKTRQRNIDNRRAQASAVRSRRPMESFDTFLQQSFAQELNEGAWDFIKGAAGEGARKLINKYAGGQSTLRDIYQAGERASSAANYSKYEAQLNALADEINKQGATLPAETRQALINKYIETLDGSAKQVALNALKQKQ